MSFRWTGFSVGVVQCWLGRLDGSEPPFTKLVPAALFCPVGRRERSQHACLWNKKVYKQRRQQVKSSETRFTSLYRRRCRWLDFCSTSSNRVWRFACQILNGVETTPIRLKAAACFGFWTPVKMCSKVQKKFTVCLHFFFPPLLPNKCDQSAGLFKTSHISALDVCAAVIPTNRNDDVKN